MYTPYDAEYAVSQRKAETARLASDYSYDGPRQKPFGFLTQLFERLARSKSDLALTDSAVRPAAAVLDKVS